MRSAQHDGNLINHEEYFAEEIVEKITFMADSIIPRGREHRKRLDLVNLAHDTLEESQKI